MDEIVPKPSAANPNISPVRQQDSPKDWKRDPIWTFLGVLIAVAGVFLAWYIYDHQTTTKALDYNVISSGPLVSVQDNLNGRLKIDFDNHPVPNVSLTVLRIANTGNVPIQQQDFVRPARIFFGTPPIKAQILSAEVSTTTPTGIGATISTRDSFVTLTPLLLNSGDSVTLKVLTAGGDGKIGADARIVGVSSFRRTDDLIPNRPSLSFYLLPFISIIIGGGAFVSLIYTTLSFWAGYRTRRSVLKHFPHIEKVSDGLGSKWKRGFFGLGGLTTNKILRPGDALTYTVTARGPDSGELQYGISVSFGDIKWQKNNVLQAVITEAHIKETLDVRLYIKSPHSYHAKEFYDDSTIFFYTVLPALSREGEGS